MSELSSNNYTVNQSTPTVFWLTFNEKNKKGESLIIELTFCEDDANYKKSLPKLWHKKGYINRVLETYWCVDTYVKDSEGRSWGAYNPQTKMENGRSVINFDWMMEATEENKEKLINEVYRIFSEATGKSATEEKLERIEAFAKENNLEIVREIPEGWVKVDYATDPSGCTSVCNTKMSWKAIKEGSFQRKLMIV